MRLVLLLLLLFTAPAGAIGVGVIALALWPSHQIWAGWAAIVDRQSRIFTLALAQDENPTAMDAALAIPGEASTLKTVQSLRRAGSDLYDAKCPPAAIRGPGAMAE